MKKRKVVVPFMAFMLMAGLAACTSEAQKSVVEGSTPGTSASAPKPSSSALPKLAVTAAKNSIMVEETTTVSCEVAGVTWTTSDAKIATVNDAGVVTGVAAGTVTITAKKEGYKNGSVSITVTRPAAIATLHMEDALHESADGWWGSSSMGQERGPGATPVYSKTAASDGTCIAYFGQGDKETLTFTSSAAINVELVLTMGSSSSVEDLSTVMSAKFNDADLSLAGVAYESEGSDYTFQGVSLGKVALKAGDNVLELSMLGSTPYLDDLVIHSKQTATITVKAATMGTIALTGIPEDNTITIEAEQTSQLTCPTAGVSYITSNEAVAIVSETGLITGVAKGNCNITVKKSGMYSARVKVVVTEKVNPGEIKVEAESGIGEGSTITTRNTSTGETITNAWPVDAVLTLKFQATEAKAMKLIMNARGTPGVEGGYNANDVDLSTAIELKFNNAKLNLTGTVTGRSNADYELGVVTTQVGENTITITNKEAAPAIDFFKLVPNA